MYKQLNKIWLVAMFFWAINLFAQAPDTLWTKTYDIDIEDGARSVQQTFDENFIVAGWTYEFVGGNFYSDVWLLKIDGKGDTLWTRRFGETLEKEFGTSVQQTPDSGYIITGWKNGSGVILIKTDPSGDTLWTRTYGASGYWGESVKQTLDGGYIIAGNTAYYSDCYIIKTNEYGAPLWTKTFGGTGHDCASEVQQTTDGGYIIAASTSSFGAGESDVWFIKTDDNGDTLWTKTFGGVGDEHAYGVQQTTDGGYIIAASTSSFGAGESDVWLIKTDDNGDTLWTKTYGNANDDFAKSVQQTFDGGYIITGYSKDMSSYLTDVYTIRTDTDGGTLWTSKYRDGETSMGRSVQQTSDGGYIIAGHTDYGGGLIDVYLIRLEHETGVGEEPSPEIFFISQSEPNPFKERTSIKYYLLKKSNVYITIYNLLGREVKKLINRNQKSGFHSAIWDGRDDSGNEVRNGVYFCRFVAGNYQSTKKLLLLR